MLHHYLRAFPLTCLQDLENNTLTQLPAAWTDQPAADVTAPLRFLRWVLAAAAFSGGCLHQVHAGLAGLHLCCAHPHTPTSCFSAPKFVPFCLCRLASNQLSGGFPAGLAAFPNLTFLLLANNDFRLVAIQGGMVGLQADEIGGCLL